MSQENVEVVRRVCAGVGENDPKVPWIGLCDERIEIRNVKAFPLADEYLGHDGVRQWVTDAWDVFSALNHEIVELVEVDDELIFTVLRTRGLMRHTGIELDGTWFGVWRVRNGKALQALGYATRDEALEAAGVSE